MLKHIGAAVFILLGACGDGGAREVVYGYYTPLFETQDPKPPPIHYPLFPPEIWKLILHDCSVLDLSNIAQTCKGLENITRQIDRSYIPKLAYQSRNLAFFQKYMLPAIPGLKPPLSPLQDLHNIFGSYKAIYDSGYMADAFTPEHVKDHDLAVKRIQDVLKDFSSPGGSMSYEERDKRAELFKDKIRTHPNASIICQNYKSLFLFIFPFTYGNDKSTIELCYQYRKEQEDIYDSTQHFRTSFYYPLSHPQAFWNQELLYIANPRLFFLLSKMPIKPKLTHLEMYGIKLVDWGNSFLTSSLSIISQLTTLRSLELKSLSLSDLPQALSTLTNLRHLDLGSNEFTNLPAVVTTLTQLGYLRLDSNSFSNLSFLTQLTCLKALGHIDLRDNSIWFIPSWITSLRGPEDRKLSISLDHNSFKASVRSFFEPLILFELIFPEISRKEWPEYNSNPKVKIYSD